MSIVPGFTTLTQELECPWDEPVMQSLPQRMKAEDLRPELLAEVRHLVRRGLICRHGHIHKTKGGERICSRRMYCNEGHTHETITEYERCLRFHYHLGDDTYMGPAVLKRIEQENNWLRLRCYLDDGFRLQMIAYASAIAGNP